MMLRSKLTTLATILAVTLASSSASAQMSDGEKKAAARAAYQEGVQLQDQGKPADALSRFEAAEKLFDAPTHLLHIAECQALTGKLVEASETYETLIRKTLPPGSPDAFTQAQDQAKAELPPLRQRIPTMRVTVKPDPSTLQNLQISVNDKQMPAELVGIARPVNPGPYRFSATANGYATPTAVDVEVREKETKSVELSLQAGAAGVVVVPPPGQQPGTPGAQGTDGSASSLPPPVDKAIEKPKQKPESPSAAGLLLGARLGLFVPGGSVEKNKKFEDYATAGPGFGLDVIGRVAKLILIGGTLEYARLGAPDSKVIGKTATGTPVSTVSTNTLYLGVLAGIMPNVDKVSFVADAGAGLRTLSQDLTVSGATTSGSGSESYSGLEVNLNVGVSIPAGPLRLVPKAGLAFGAFSSRSGDCNVTTGGVTVSGCAGNGSIDSAGHTFFNVVLGVYYHVDLAKKSVSASFMSPVQTAGR